MCSKHLFLESEKWFCWTQTRQTGRHGIEYYIWNLFFKSVWLTKRGEKHNFQYLLRGEKDKTSVQRRKFPSWFLSKETIIWRSLLSPPLDGRSWSVVVSMRSVLTLARSEQGRGYSEQFYTNPWYFWQNISTLPSEECKVVQGHKTAIIPFIKIIALGKICSPLFAPHFRFIVSDGALTLARYFALNWALVRSSLSAEHPRAAQTWNIHQDMKRSGSDEGETNSLWLRSDIRSESDDNERC